MINVICPNCQSKLELSEAPKVGLTVKCSNCGTSLEVVWLYPITLDISESNINLQTERSLENGFA